MILQAFPIFTESHILRKEMLEALSDYGILYHQYFYKGYANGIVTGCELTTTKEAIIVNPGVLCCHSARGPRTASAASPRYFLPL